MPKYLNKGKISETWVTEYPAYSPTKIWMTVSQTVRKQTQGLKIRFDRAISKTCDV